MSKPAPNKQTQAFEDLIVPATEMPASAARVIQGRLIPARQQIFLYSSDDWEEFLNEWAQSQKAKYAKIARLTGTGDMGIDIAAFVDAPDLKGIWDNFQCKHYADALTPSVALPEIAKILWHSFNGEYAPPRSYYFSAPKDCGLKLSRLLLDPTKLKEKLLKDWTDTCADEITSTRSILLDGEFLAYVDGFDFSIFKYKPTLELVEEHKATPWHAPRFGGGLPDRPPVSAPPDLPTIEESRYLRQLLQAYSSSVRSEIAVSAALDEHPKLKDHYRRQREFFYHAESLRNFARDNVPSGTFEDLQEEVYTGVADLGTTTFPDGLAYLNATTQAAAGLSLTANALIHVTKVQDKRGICHQLANGNRLVWVKP